jgi:hypothetical protein
LDSQNQPTVVAGGLQLLICRKTNSMKKLAILLFIVCCTEGQAQYPSSKDSINLFYDSLIYQLKTRYLYRDSVEWNKLDAIKAEALQADNFGSSLTHCTAMFDAIGGSHLNIFSQY